MGGRGRVLRAVCGRLRGRLKPWAGVHFPAVRILEVHNKIVICRFGYIVAFCDIRFYIWTMRNEPFNRSNKRKGEPMNLETVNSLSDAPAIMHSLATVHVDASAFAALRVAFARLQNLETARPRDIAYFAAAIVRAHYARRAAFSVSFRAVANGCAS